jgi:hypothetical protein
MTVKIGGAASVELKIADNELAIHCMHLQWSSFVNTGYLVQGEVHDPNHVALKRIARGSDSSTIEYLKDGRRKPMPVKFLFKWDKENKTEERIAYLTQLHGYGRGQQSFIKFIAIDPPSFLLNSGTADGRVYTGKVSSVIKDCISDFTGNTDGIPNLDIDVTETNDNPKNKFYMARMDPKTFIGTLLDWSSPLSSDKSRWIVSCKDTKINIKKESDLEGVDLGTFTVAPTGSQVARDVDNWELLMNNFVTAYQARMVTAGISSVSGAYLDTINNEDEVIVDDENTAQKRNVDVKSDRAFTKPGDSDVWPQGLPATFLSSIPEFNAGDIGLKYQDYIDGRARQKFINMLPLTMRIRIDIDGNKDVNDSELLGVSTCSLMWKDIDQEENLYFLHGCWIVYGFNHVYNKRKGRWTTQLYLYRIDHDAESKILKCAPPS